MFGNLYKALEELILQALPGIFGKDSRPSPVQLSISSDLVEVDPESAEAAASEPQPDDYTDDFPFDPDNPGGPYTLSQPPYPGPRRIYLITDNGESIPIREKEVIWDETDLRVFTFDLSPNRELSVITGVKVLYGITAIFTKIKEVQTLNIVLQSTDVEKLEAAEALVIAVIALNRRHIVDESRFIYKDSGYSADVKIKNLVLVKGTSPVANQHLITLKAEVELKAGRALREDEGIPIRHILLNGGMDYGPEKGRSDTRS